MNIYILVFVTFRKHDSQINLFVRVILVMSYCLNKLFLEQLNIIRNSVVAKSSTEMVQSLRVELRQCVIDGLLY